MNPKFLKGLEKKSIHNLRAMVCWPTVPCARGGTVVESRLKSLHLRRLKRRTTVPAENLFWHSWQANEDIMLELWNDTRLAIGDALLGWLLYLPSDLVLLALALLTGVVMVFTRPFATNQDLLRRIDEDGRRLKELSTEAKKTNDRQALTRHRATGNYLALRKLAAEGKPLLYAIVPVALLATWAMSRVAYHPPAEGEEIEVVAFMKESTALGELIHIVPEAGLDTSDNWIQVIGKNQNKQTWIDRFLIWARLAEPEPEATATWTIKGKARKEPYVLTIPLGDVTIQRKLLIGQTTYADAVVPATDKEPITTQIKMRPVELFGIVPGLGDLVPGWLVGYIIIVVPLVFLLKWATGIY
jgi:uncharacterized membrane protein (DUF106 family)